MSERRFSMVEECASQYEVKDCGEKGVLITIRVPTRFADLWSTKLSALDTTMAEISEYEPP